MSDSDSGETSHRIVIGNSQAMEEVESSSVDLVVTSPPYPMIEMWDDTFSGLNPAIGEALALEDGRSAFELMHAELDKTWGEVSRVMKEGGIACINIGDATRTIGGCFRRYSNHSRATNWFEGAGLITLPSIIWRKPTNAPNKFMGSGMLPPGAYVTLEHEHILVFRKGERRSFDTPDEKRLRSESSYFWEERNLWFSDVWTDIVGTSQSLDGDRGRQRSAAFPFELAYRLMNMFSVKNDTVLDPFIGTGTTTLAAIASRRNSVGYEIDENLLSALKHRLRGFEDIANAYIDERVRRHLEFTERRACKFVNKPHGFGCVSGQEVAIKLERLESVTYLGPETVTARYGSPDRKN
jgi:DNA modification methylase